MRTRDCTASCLTYHFKTKKNVADTIEMSHHLFHITAPAQNVDVFRQFDASWDTDDRSGSPIPESSSLGIYRPEEDGAANASYEEFETPVKCIVLYNYTVRIFNLYLRTYLQLVHRGRK